MVCYAASLCLFLTCFSFSSFSLGVTLKFLHCVVSALFSNLILLVSKTLYLSWSFFSDSCHLYFSQRKIKRRKIIQIISSLTGPIILDTPKIRIQDLKLEIRRKKSLNNFPCSHTILLNYLFLLQLICPLLCLFFTSEYFCKLNCDHLGRGSVLSGYLWQQHFVSNAPNSTIPVIDGVQPPPHAELPKSKELLYTRFQNTQNAQ